MKYPYRKRNLMKSEPWMTCPECGGEWRRNFVWNHVRNECWIGTAEDSRQFADHDRGERTFQRLATHAEMVLAEHVSGVPVIPEAEFRDPMDPPPKSEPVCTRVTLLTGGIFHRVIGGVDAPERGAEL